MLKDHRFLSICSLIWKTTYYELNWVRPEQNPCSGFSRFFFIFLQIATQSNVVLSATCFWLQPFIMTWRLPCWTLIRIQDHKSMPSNLRTQPCCIFPCGHVLACQLWTLEPWVVLLLIWKITSQTIISKIIHNSIQFIKSKGK